MFVQDTEGEPGSPCLCIREENEFPSLRWHSMAALYGAIVPVHNIRIDKVRARVCVRASEIASDVTCECFLAFAAVPRSSRSDSTNMDGLAVNMRVKLALSDA